MDDGLIKRLHADDPIAAERIERSLEQIGQILQLNALIDLAILEELCAATGVPKRGSP